MNRYQQKTYDEVKNSEGLYAAEKLRALWNIEECVGSITPELEDINKKLDSIANAVGLMYDNGLPVKERK